MKYTKRTILVTLLLLPVITIFLFDAGFSSLQHKICTQYISYKGNYACMYRERNERDRVVTTAFYRHIGRIFGRPEGTSASAIDDTVVNAHLDRSSVSFEDAYNAGLMIGLFNLAFFSTMFFTTIAASVAATIIVQKVIHKYRNNKHS